METIIQQNIIPEKTMQENMEIKEEFNTKTTNDLDLLEKESVVLKEENVIQPEDILVVTEKEQATNSEKNIGRNKKGLHLTISTDNTLQTDDKEDASSVGPWNFVKIDKLGTGFCGKVYLVQSRGLINNGIFAMKVMDKEEMVRRERVHRVLTEQQILAIANHPFIVTLYHSFHTKKRLYLILQYCAGGEFFRFLQHQPLKRLRERDAAFYAAEVLLALEYLHVHGLIYRDLKPENLLMHESGHLVLSDFDLSSQHTKAPVRISPTKRGNSNGDSFTINNKLLPRNSTTLRRHSWCSSLFGISYPILDSESHLTASGKRKSFVGTHEYIAPEIIAEQGYAGSVDWWALGILIYEMIFGMTPFKGKTKMETLENISDDNEELIFPPHVIVSSECKDLLSRLLEKDISKRMKNPGDIKEHLFFNNIQWALIRNQTPPIVPTVMHPMDTHHFQKYNHGESSDEEILLHPSSPLRKRPPTFPKRPISPALKKAEASRVFDAFTYSTRSDESGYWKGDLSTNSSGSSREEDTAN